MAYTIQSGADLARIDTNDTDPAAYRTPDVDMAKHANSALLAIFNRAPHLWHGNYGAEPDGSAVLTDPFPVHAQWLKPFADIIVAFIESKDDEYVLEQRVSQVISRALSLLVS